MKHSAFGGNPLSKVIIVFTWELGNWGAENLSHLPKVSQLIKWWNWIETQAMGLQRAHRWPLHGTASSYPIPLFPLHTWGLLMEPGLQPKSGSKAHALYHHRIDSCGRWFILGKWCTKSSSWVAWVSDSGLYSLVRNQFKRTLTKLC